MNSELYSHPKPKKLLEEHLNNVAWISKSFIENIKFDDDFANKDELIKVSQVIALLHDIGKSTSFFQEYLFEESETKKLKLKNKPETRHSFFSAMYAYLVAKELGLDEIYQGLIFITIKKHHSDLSDFGSETDIKENQIKTIKEQINSINKEKFNILLENIDYSNFNLDWFSEKINSIDEKFFLPFRRNIKKILRSNDLKLYFLQQILFSVLIDADKNDASQILDKNNLEKRENIKSDIVDLFKNKKFPTPQKPIDNIREEIYKTALDKISNLPLDKKILSLNVPTGIGKTLTSFSCALKLRERLEKQGLKPRIIYSLPFTSIIDQNFDVFEDILKNDDNSEVYSNILLKHHYLNEISYTSEDDREYEAIESKFLIEGWLSEIIVTTFVQFFHTIFGYQNKSLRKFHRIANSIIILDEIQSIPHHYWLLFKDVLKFMADKLNCYFILVTATKPLIFDENEITELVEDRQKYFENLDRINLENLSFSDSTIQELVENVIQDYEKYPDKSILVVLNTINSARDVYNLIKDKIDEDDCTLYYLSTHIVPYQRLERIKEIRESKERKIVVSTQLIEAGVDIDLDIVYRDFAPLDSINQVAGRCNRNSVKDKGIVKIFMLKPENSKKYYYSYIYDSFLIGKTKEILEKYKDETIPENKFFDLANEYFNKVKIGGSQDDSNKFLEAIYKLDYDELSKFKLIEEDFRKVEVFVEIDEDAENTLKKYREIKEIEDFNIRRNAYLKIKNKFSQYIISIPERNLKNNMPPIDKNINMFFIQNSELSHYYSMETGFKPENDEAFIW